MAATLSSFIPPIFRTSLQPSEGFDGDFSYSYSELPVFRSRDSSKFESAKSGANGARAARDGGTPDAREPLNCEERKAVSLPYRNVERCVSLPRAKFDFQTACTNLPPKTIDKEKNEIQNANKRTLKFKIIPDKDNSVGENANLKSEESRKRFEFQTTCTNLPPKNIDKEKNAGCEGRISSALRLNLKRRCEEARKKFEFQTTCTNLPLKSLTEGVAARKVATSAGSPVKAAALEHDKKCEFQTHRDGPTANSALLSVTFDFQSPGAQDTDRGSLPPKVFDRKFETHKAGEAYSRFCEQPASADLVEEVGAYQSPDSPAKVSENRGVDGNFDFDNTDGGARDRSTVASSVRRLRNSIFSSLKLPRKVCCKMAAQQQLMGSLGRDGSAARNYAMGTGSLASSNANSKRKSAVELLAESKAFYVKSETVLDRKQELPLRVSGALSSSTGTHYATLSGRHRRGGGEALQSQLRRLLGSTSMQSPNDSAHESRNGQNTYYTEKRSSRECCDWEIPSHPSSATRSHYNSGTFSGNSSSGTSGSKGQVKSDPEHSRTSNTVPFSTKSLNRPSSSGDNRIFFPDSFVVPKPSRSDPANVFSNSFSIGSPFSSPEKIDARKILSVVDAYEGSDYGILDPKVDFYDDTDLIEDFSTISPPAEYAITERSNYRYVRSNSHSHTMKTGQDNSYAMNINSHKSLPDLHKQAEDYPEEERRLSGASGGVAYLGVTCDPIVPRLPQCDTTMRSSEALSSYSKATSGRSNRSSVFSSKASDGHSRRSISCHNSDPSAQTLDDTYYYNRSGSSYARDSGGSSGHCSGGPPSLRVPPAQQQRRDSGSSTQHSRSHRYSSYYDGYEPDASHLEYRVSAPPQFQDGATTPRQGSVRSQYQGETVMVAPPQYQTQPYQGELSHHPQQQGLNVNATVQICANFGSARTVQGATVTRVATGMEEGRSQTLVGIHFQASIPPVQFQDGQPQGYGSYGSEGFYGRRESGARESRHMMPHRSSSAYNQQMVPARYTRTVEEQPPAPVADDTTASPPGLGNFRRQRCLRYKQRRPVLRSKSDISDRYYRSDTKSILPIMDKPLSNTPPSSTDNESPDRITRSQLDKFFDQLGFNDESYQQVVLNPLKKPPRTNTKTDQQNNSVKKSSPNPDLQAANLNANCGSPKVVYLPDDDAAASSDSPVFSEISIADSNLIANNGDYTVQGMGPKDPRLYRSCEPPSIVERNARIIKWLCNCRKLQAI